MPKEPELLQQALLGLYEQMLGDMHLPDLLQRLASVVSRSLQSERATIYLADHETQELRSVAVTGNVSHTIRVPISSASLAGHCASTRQAFLVPDAYGDLAPVHPDLRFDHTWDKASGFRTRDVMCAPAVCRSALQGVVQVINSKAEPFTKDHLASLESLARLVAFCLYDARLYDELANLKQLKKAQAQFMRILVHELKSPLSAARMLIDVLAESPDQAGVTSVSARMATRLDQMQGMIADILELATVKAGDPLGGPQELDLVPATRSVCEPYAEVCARKALAFQVRTPASMVVVRMAPRAYHLILSNLVSNAVKYTHAGQVTVELDSVEDDAIVSVTDTGIGIPEADIPKLFQEFHRAANARRSGIAGTGVGLASVKDLVERFGGSLNLESREGHGSSLAVRFPLAAAKTKSVSSGSA